ncbi:MAG: hypothetical protein CMD18_06445 [Flavobacteriales bacterium]|nr:hypothetical protein [Flavobacteriales bacterium]
MNFKIHKVLPFLLLFTGSLFGVNVNFQYNNHCINNIIFFKDISTSKTKIITWFWEFGDGGVANEIAPVHVYSEPGNYKVKLTVKTEKGVSYSLKKYILINAAPFAFFYPNAKCDQTVGFTDNSFTKSAQVTQWIWNFGDENYSLEKNPSHRFQNTKKTKVHLKVKDQNGCVDSISQIVTIKKKPKVGFDIKNVLLSNPTFIKLKSHNIKDSITYLMNNEIIKKGSPLLMANPYKSSLIKQKVKNNMGCTDSLTAFIFPKEDFQIKLPAYFQLKSNKNSSSFGINNPDLVVKEMSIFNEDGKEVFYACNNTLWNGKDKKGVVCANGNYTYLLDYENLKEIRVIQKGSFIFKHD